MNVLRIQKGENERQLGKKLLDELIKDYKNPEDLIGETGLLKQLTKALMERALNAELTHHLGYEKHDQAGNNSGNSRDGTTPKTVKGEFGENFRIRKPLAEVGEWMSGEPIPGNPEGPQASHRIATVDLSAVDWNDYVDGGLSDDERLVIEVLVGHGPARDPWHTPIHAVDAALHKPLKSPSVSSKTWS